MDLETPGAGTAEKYANCPIPKTHRRLAEAHLLWHQTMEAYHDSSAFLANLNSVIQALRNVTFVLQSEKKALPNFEVWYGQWQERLKADAAAKWLVDARNTVVKQGELETQSTAEVRIVTWRDEVLGSVTVPAEIPSSEILANLALFGFSDKIPPSSEHSSDAAIAIERRWSAAGLGGSELLDTLAHVYGLLGDLILDAHTHLNRLECIPSDEVHPDFRSPYHRTGTLECMVAGVERRTQRFQLSSRDEYFPIISSTPVVELGGLGYTYGFGRQGEIASWQQSDPAQLAEKVLYRAKRILSHDKHHERTMFFRDGEGRWHNVSLFARDSTEKHLLMRLAADFVERKGCDALIEVGEVWSHLAATRGKDVTSGRTPERHEALMVRVMTRGGFRRTYITLFTRGPFGGIRLADSQEFDDKSMWYLQPIFEVWKKQGFFQQSDGSHCLRIWEPDPLDVCFCGGPKRFAECCKPHVKLDARFDLLINGALAESDFQMAERFARAAVAQYVIWVKQHTAPMMNANEKLYRDFVDIDILALEANIDRMVGRQAANGNTDGLVQQLRQLARIVGVPRVSVRLTAIASSWLLREGRVEEAVLELDSLGDPDKIEDSLALILIATSCDVDANASHDMLRRAASHALSKYEKWESELALARSLFDRGKREESLQLADSVIAESTGPEGVSSLLSEASLLRWRITRTDEDFQSARTALESDSQRAPRVAVLIDEGMYEVAEELLAGPCEAGDLRAKLLTADARLRGGNEESAGELLSSIEDEQVPTQLLLAYAVAAAHAALALRDDSMRRRALAAFSRIPSTVIEADSGVRSIVAALAGWT